MGVLTENRKLFAEVCCSYPWPFPFRFDSEVDLPPAKRARVTSVPPAAPGLPAPVLSDALKVPIARIVNFPPPLPLRRPIHAPQRNSKFARAASAKSQPRVLEKEGGGTRDMGNIFSCLREATALRPFGLNDESENEVTMHASDYTCSQSNANCEGLTVEKYKELVQKQEGLSAGSSKPLEVGQSSKQTDSDSTLLTTPEKGIAGLLEDDALDKHVRGTPVYKSILESSRTRDSKLNHLDFEVKLFEKKLSAFKLIQPKPAKEDVTRELFIPLMEADEDEVDRALGGCNREYFLAEKPGNELLVRAVRHLTFYKCLESIIRTGSCCMWREVLVAHESSNIEISREMLQCLKPGAWLNDEVINLYLELLKERERRDPKKFLNCHFFNTFFYKKLIGGRGGYDYKSVKRWTTQRKIGYSLIDCDKIFVPIHKEIHWCLAIISIKDEKLQYLDSLGGRDTNVLNVLAKYLMDEVKDKSNRDINVSSWKQEFVDDLPEQKNGWDCGMFMIKYVDFYSRGLNLCFSQEHMPYFRRRTAKEILHLRAD